MIMRNAAPDIVSGWDASSNRKRQPDDHQAHWRLSAILNGAYHHTSPNTRSIGPGHLLLTPPHHSSGWTPAAGAQEACVVFSLDETADDLWGSPITQVMQPDLGQRFIPRLITITSMWWISPRHRVRANALLSLVLVDLVDTWDPPPSYPAPPERRATTDQRILSAETLARSRLNSWTVADMAAAVGMERSAFTRLFTRERDCSPGAWLDAARLSLAQSMLINDDASLRTIAAWCGHPRQQSFGRWFSARTGVPPGAYRAAAKGLPSH